MLNLNSLMIGTTQVQAMGEFYEKVLGRKADMHDEGWYGWKVGETFLNIGEHSEVSGANKEPARIILNLETEDVKGEYERIKATGAKVVKELYEMEGMPDMWIATFADPDNNYFQLMSPWKGDIAA